MDEDTPDLPIFRNRGVTGVTKRQVAPVARDVKTRGRTRSITRSTTACSGANARSHHIVARVRALIRGSRTPLASFYHKWEHNLDGNYQSALRPLAREARRVARVAGGSFLVQQWHSVGQVVLLAPGERRGGVGGKIDGSNRVGSLKLAGAGFTG